MKKLKLRPKVCNSEMGYYISSPIYAGIDNKYLSHWQQTSPYYFRLGNLSNYIEKNINNKTLALYLLQDCAELWERKNRLKHDKNKSKTT